MRINENYQFSLFDTDLHRLQLPGLKIAITGTLPILRKDAIQAIQLAGGLYGASVSRNTDILIVGKFHEGMGISRKLAYARKLRESGCNIQIISPQDFFNILNSF